MPNRAPILCDSVRWFTDIWLGQNLCSACSFGPIPEPFSWEANRWSRDTCPHELGTFWASSLPSWRILAFLAQTLLS